MSDKNSPALIWVRKSPDTEIIINIQQRIIWRRIWSIDYKSSDIYLEPFEGGHHLVAQGEEADRLWEVVRVGLP